MSRMGLDTLICRFIHNTHANDNIPQYVLNIQGVRWRAFGRIWGGIARERRHGLQQLGSGNSAASPKPLPPLGPLGPVPYQLPPYHKLPASLQTAIGKVARTAGLLLLLVPGSEVAGKTHFFCDRNIKLDHSSLNFKGSLLPQDIRKLNIINNAKYLLTLWL